MGRRKTVNIEELADQANSAHRTVEQNLSTAVLYANDAGSALLVIKKHLQSERKKGRPAPNWMDWTKANFDASHETANVYMRIAKNWDRLKNQALRGKLSIAQALKLLRPRESGKLPQTEKEKEKNQQTRYKKWIQQIIKDELSIWDDFDLRYIAVEFATDFARQLRNLRYELRTVGIIFERAAKDKNRYSRAYQRRILELVEEGYGLTNPRNQKTRELTAFQQRIIDFETQAVTKE